MLTSVQITEEDHKFCKDHDLKFSELLRMAILEQKQLSTGEIVSNIQSERAAKEKFIKMSGKLRDFIQDHGLMDELLKEEGFL